MAYLMIIENIARKNPQKKYGIVYCENSGIPDFLAIWKLLQSPLYSAYNGNIDLFSIKNQEDYY